MIGRRELMIGGVAAATAATAFAMKPRERMSMLNGTKLDDLIPKSIGGWTYVPSDALVVPEGDDSLAAKLYSQTIARLYTRANGDSVMLLIAYGDTQSDQLQLHRPEVCYPAFGFTVTETKPTRIALGQKHSISGRNMTARSTERTEMVSYWTRIGEFLPVSGVEQRTAKLRSEIGGIIPDGVLVRTSFVADRATGNYSPNHEFVRALVAALSPKARRALLGTDLAKAVAIPQLKVAPA